MNTSTLESRYEAAMATHRAGNLAEARLLYREILAEDGTRTPTKSEIELVLRFAPLLYVTPAEPFPLRDAAAVCHPRLPLLAYHLFWDADIEFPAGNDACDHEVVWLLLDERRERVEKVFTFYHGTIIASYEGARDAMERGGRARIFVQWGKHGSLPVDWEKIEGGRFLESMRKTYHRLHAQGCKDADHPLAREWPHSFAGTWDEFTDFSQEVDPRPLLSRSKYIMIGERASAIIAVYFLRYCFAVKESWPDFRRSGAGIF